MKPYCTLNEAICQKKTQNSYSKGKLLSNYEYNLSY